MTESNYLNKVTLEYLLNPYLYEKISKKNINLDEELLNEILFYRKRITHLTKEMSKGNYINDNFKKLFFNYSATLIYYFKQIDEKDILQEEYENLELNKPGKEIHKEYNAEENNLLIKKTQEINNLDNFVKKINISPAVEKILPKQRNPNIKNPDLKKKGIKKDNL